MNDYAVDRGAADRVLAAVPEIRVWAHGNRAFVRRAADLMCAEGADQFLDMRDPDALPARPELRERIDLSRPVGVLLIAMLHFLRGEQESFALLNRRPGDLPAGSFAAISHAESDTHPERARFMEEMYAATSSPGQGRPQAEVRRFFDRLTLLEPGVVHLADWRPRPGEPYCDPDQVWEVCGIGRWEGRA